MVLLTGNSFYWKIILKTLCWRICFLDIHLCPEIQEWETVLSIVIEKCKYCTVIHKEMSMYLLFYSSRLPLFFFIDFNWSVGWDIALLPSSVNNLLGGTAYFNLGTFRTLNYLSALGYLNCDIHESQDGIVQVCTNILTEGPHHLSDIFQIWISFYEWIY